MPREDAGRSGAAPAASTAPRPPRVKPLRDREAGRGTRRSNSIHAYVGPNGSGKSLAMVHDTLPSLDAGRSVLSTVRLLDATGEPHPHYVRLTDWSQLLDAEHCDVLFDEVVGIASARESAGMPVQVQNLLVQLRRRDITLRWTAPNWARADKIIREVTQAVTLCAGSMSDRKNDDLWAPKRLFKFKTYDTAEFDEWTLNKSHKLARIASAWFWGPNSRAFASYDTMGQVERVGEVLDSGRCAHCGGRRVVPLCHCDEQPRERRSRSQRGPVAGSGVEAQGVAGVPGGWGQSGRDRGHGDVNRSPSFAPEAAYEAPDHPVRPSHGGDGSDAQQQTAQHEDDHEHGYLFTSHGVDRTVAELRRPLPSDGHDAG